jgi:hypothetical protein
MTKIGIIICGRYLNCGGGKCLRALKEHVGGFAKYPKDELLELVGYKEKLIPHLLEEDKMVMEAYN